MIIAISPYHLTTREAPAMASMLLASSVVTVAPGPGGGDGGTGGVASAMAAARKSATYRELAQSWEWSVPLWREGVVAGVLDGLSPLDEMGGVLRRICETTDLPSLRGFIQDDLYDDPGRYLASLSRDLMKGGPDPGILLPLLASLDRFAARNATCVARSVAVSVAQKAEVRLGKPVFGVAIPLLLQASAERMIHARAVLHDALTPLRRAIDEVVAACEEDASGEIDGSLVAAEAERYAAAYEGLRSRVAEGCVHDEVRMVEGVVTVQGLLLPADAVLRSSEQAMRELAGGARRIRNGDGPDGSGTTLPAVYDAMEHARVLTLVMKPLGARGSGKR
jgi:hypothetical protein